MSRGEEFYEKATGRPGTQAENEDTAAGLFAIAYSINELAHAIHRLGDDANEATARKEMEAHGDAIIDAAETIATAISASKGPA